MKKEGIENLLEARKSLETSLNKILVVTGKILEPLKGLTEEQKEAVVRLGLMMQAIALAKRPTTKVAQETLVQFGKEIDNFCPPLGKATIAQDPCFESTVSYLTSLKKCQDDGRTEEECEEAWGYGAMSVMCTMEKINELGRRIGEWPGGGEHPGPIPRPIA
jgi:hypothetical protein